MAQLPLELPHRPSFAGADFLVSSSNEAAVAWLDRWPDWPAPGLAVYGPPGCGKTHLAHVFRQRSGAFPVEREWLAADGPARLPADLGAAVLDLPAGSPVALPEEPLLHLYNQLAERGRKLLVCAELPPARWSLRLLDLASRLGALPAVRIEPPDDALLAALLLKLFADRQLAVEPETARFLAVRIDRSFQAARDIVAALDRAALAQRRRITTSLAAKLLADEAAP